MQTSIPTFHGSNFVQYHPIAIFFLFFKEKGSWLDDKILPSGIQYLGQRQYQHNLSVKEIKI